VDKLLAICGHSFSDVIIRPAAVEHESLNKS
jgi:hypothetical protein